MNTPTPPTPTPTPPPPAAQPKKSRKGWYIGGAVAALFVAGGIGAAVAPAEDPVEVAAESTEAPAPTSTEDTRVTVPPVTEAPTTTQAPTTTRATVPPPPPAPEESLADLVEDLWVATSYCYTDCSNLNTAQEWVDRSERYGRIDTGSFVTGYEYLDSRPFSEIDDVCDEFWVMDDDDVADLAVDAGIDPAAWVLNMYLWCDS
jgi:hypothetical protein